MAAKDYYATLGIEKNASADDIKSAYRRLAKKYHPDVFATQDESKKKEAEVKFKEIQHAYEVLSDPQKRAAFDQYGSEDGPSMSGYGGGGGFNPFGGGGGFADDIINNIFSAFTGGGGRAARYEREGDDIEVVLNLSFEEAFFGVEKEITYSRIEKCRTCGGTGAKDSSSIKTCSKCGGTGSVRVSQRTPFGMMQTTRTCDACRGEGKIIEDKCADCKGRGKVKKERTIKVKIPAGIDNGQMLTMRGEGSAGDNTAANGNLIIIFKVSPHEYFMRDGVNLNMELPITFIQAALGARIDIPTMSGTVPVDIPEGTQNATIIRVKGRGVKYLKKDAYGDLFIKVVVDIPKSLTMQQRSKLKDLEKSFEKANFEKVQKFKKVTKGS